MMLLFWVAAEDFWERPRLAGFGSEAAAPVSTFEQLRTRIYVEGNQIFAHVYTHTRTGTCF